MSRAIDHSRDELFCAQHKQYIDYYFAGVVGKGAGMSEEDFIRQRRIDEGLEPLEPDVAVTGSRPMATPITPKQ